MCCPPTLPTFQPTLYPSGAYSLSSSTLTRCSISYVSCHSFAVMSNTVSRCAVGTMTPDPTSTSWDVCRNKHVSFSRTTRCSGKSQMLQKGQFDVGTQGLSSHCSRSSVVRNTRRPVSDEAVEY